MKTSISVPDDLWAAVHPAGGSPSATVQRALRLLADAAAIEGVALGRAPDQANLDRYRKHFEDAVAQSMEQIHVMLDHGYRFGLILAAGLAGSDFDLLEGRPISGEIQEIVRWEGKFDFATLSDQFCGHVAGVMSIHKSNQRWALSQDLAEVLGHADHTAIGVQWKENPEEDPAPVLSDTFTEGVIAALRDVRDEAIRRQKALRSSDRKQR